MGKGNGKGKGLTEAQKIESRIETNRKYAAKRKQKRDDGFVDKSHENKKTANRAYQVAKREDPEWQRNRKEYVKTDKYKESQPASCKKWRQSDKGKDYYQRQFEALRRAYVQEWRDLLESDVDSHLTQDDIDALENANGATISAEVDKFLTEVKLVEGPCAGLTFMV